MRHGLCVGKTRKPFVIPPVTQPIGLSILAGQRSLCKPLVRKLQQIDQDEMVSMSELLIKLKVRMVLVLALGLSWLAAINVPSIAYAAHNDKLASRKPFQLKVTVDELPQLSRNEIDTGSQNKAGSSRTEGNSFIGEIALPSSIDDPGSIPQIGFVPPATRQSNSYVPQESNDGAEAPPNREQNASAPPQDSDDANGSMQEYGVDWSSWVSKLADRWFFALTKMESQSGLQFHTIRPALIHFTCYPNGQIANMYVKQSSGVPLYDQMQMEALLKIVPLHSFPRGTQRASFTLVQGWESHPRRPGEEDFQPGSFGKGTPMEIVKQWMNWR